MHNVAITLLQGQQPSAASYSDDDIVDVFTQRLVTPFNIYKSVFIPIGEYHWTRHQLTYGTSQAHRFIMTFFERFGTYYDGHLTKLVSEGPIVPMSAFRSHLASSGIAFGYRYQMVTFPCLSGVFRQATRSHDS